jgi:hypothetical protein
MGGWGVKPGQYAAGMAGAESDGGGVGRLRNRGQSGHEGKYWAEICGVRGLKREQLLAGEVRLELLRRLEIAGHSSVMPGVKQGRKKSVWGIGVMFSFARFVVQAFRDPSKVGFGCRSLQIDQATVFRALLNDRQ